jgi:hypothetical protein
MARRQNLGRFVPALSGGLQRVQLSHIPSSRGSDILLGVGAAHSVCADFYRAVHVD